MSFNDIQYAQLSLIKSYRDGNVNKKSYENMNKIMVIYDSMKV